MPEDRMPLMAEEGSLRQRNAKKPEKEKPKERYVPTDWDTNLPYGGKVYLARRKLPDPLWVRITEVF